MMLPSASSLQRVMTCTPSGVLPRVESVDENEDAVSGNWLHKYLEIVAYDKNPETLIANLRGAWKEHIPEKYHADCTAIQLDKLPVLRSVKKEIAYAFSPKDSAIRVLGVGIDRDYFGYGLREDEYPGTADVVGVDDGGLVVLDYKTGSAFSTPPAAENWQLRFLAVCAADNLGIDHGRVIICKTRGDLRCDVSEFGPGELHRWRLALTALALRLRLKPEQMTYRTGDHCKYCPSNTLCPAQTSLVRMAVRSPSLEAEKISSALTPDNAKEAYAMVRAWENALRNLKQQLGMFARSNPIHLDNGNVYGEEEYTKEAINTGVAWSVLKEKFGVDVAEKCVTIDVTETGISRGLKPLAERGKHAGMVRDTLADIAKAGGIELSTAKRLTEHKEK